MKHVIITALLLIFSTAAFAQDSFISKYQSMRSPYGLASYTYLPESMINGMRGELEKKYPSAFVKALRTLTIVECWGHTYFKVQDLRRVMNKDRDSLINLTDKSGNKVYRVIYIKKGNFRELDDKNNGYSIVYLGKVDERQTKRFQKHHPGQYAYSEIVCFSAKGLSSDNAKALKQEVDDRIFVFTGSFTDDMLTGINNMAMAPRGFFRSDPLKEQDNALASMSSHQKKENALTLIVR